MVAVAGVVDDDAAAGADVRELEAAMEVDDEAAEAAVDPAVDGAADEDAAVDEAAVDELILVMFCCCLVACWPFFVSGRTYLKQML